MIIVDLNNCQELPETPGFEEALAFLRSCPLDQPDGKLEISGDDVYAIIQSYATKEEREAPRFEAHRKYIDIQFLLSGRELMGWAPLKEVSVTEPYDENKDILFGRVNKASQAFVSFQPRQAIVLFPSDAHAPGLCLDKPEPVRKVVVKIKV